MTEIMTLNKQKVENILSFGFNQDQFPLLKKTVSGNSKSLKSKSFKSVGVQKQRKTKKIDFVDSVVDILRKVLKRKEKEFLNKSGVDLLKVTVIDCTEDIKNSFKI